MSSDVYSEMLYSVHFSQWWSVDQFYAAVDQELKKMEESEIWQQCEDPLLPSKAREFSTATAESVLCALLKRALNVTSLHHLDHCLSPTSNI